VNNFIGFCLEKGIGAKQDTSVAFNMYEKDIAQTQRVLYSRYRSLIVLKQKKGLTFQQPDQELEFDEEYVDTQVKDLKETLAKRFEDASRMDCYLSYVYGKLYEKLEDDIDVAIDWYQKGVESSTDACLKNHLLCNESWRLKCKKRLQKLQMRKGMKVFIVNKNRED